MRPAIAASPWCGTARPTANRLHGSDVGLQHLEVVQPPEQFLRPLERPDERRGRRHTAVGRKLETVSKLLTGNSYLVKAFGRIELAGLVNGGHEPPGAIHESRAERLPPDLAVVQVNGLGDRLQAALEFLRVDGRQLGEHRLSPAVPFFDDVKPDVLEGWPGQIIGRR